MLAHAFLAVVRADEHARNPAPDALVPLSCNEIQHPFITLVFQPLHDVNKHDPLDSVPLFGEFEKTPNT